jgi:site-specific DNA-methyltransferase (adenine-specific)
MPAGRPHAIAGDRDTGLRDEVLALWGDRPAMVFGVFGVAEPAGTVQRLIYRKPPDAGTHGTHAGFRHDVELVYLVGKWPAALGGRSSVLETRARMAGGALGMAGRYGHPHAKPADVMEQLIAACPAGVIVDPFAGSGSTLIAARHLGREAIGVEVEPLYAEAAARRLAQGVLA